jgi:hypothetical protein
MIFPGRQNGHIVIQAADPANYDDIVNDYDHLIPIGMRDKAYFLEQLLSRLDLRLYRALVRKIVYNYAIDMGFTVQLPTPATLPTRWRYRGERSRRPRRTT